ncbi:nanos-like protein 2-like [Huso huso]|uniref:Nanos-like protein 2-like n=1 Tax=Huso huso TaxID=61971 RepID=A0ABR0Y6K6_HUSHU
MDRSIRYFDMWIDYLNLGAVVQDLQQNSGGTLGVGSDVAPGSHTSISTSQSGCSERESRTQSPSPAGSPSESCCGFCKQNDETVQVYSSHCLRTDDGKVCCPVLRNYVCPFCKATGDRAHTRRYCPRQQGQHQGQNRAKGTHCNRPRLKH